MINNTLHVKMKEIVVLHLLDKSFNTLNLITYAETFVQSTSDIFLYFILSEITSHWDQLFSSLLTSNGSRAVSVYGLWT